MRITHTQSRALYLAPQILIRRIGVNACCLKAGVPKQSLNDIHRNAGQRQIAAAGVANPMNRGTFKCFRVNVLAALFKRLCDVVEK